MVDEEASLRGRWDRASLLLLQESTKPCPKCSAPVERNGMNTGSSNTSTSLLLPGVHMCCLPLQAAVCTCSVLCARQNGVGCVESSGTESVWETTGLVNTSSHLQEDLEIINIFIIISNWEMQRIVGDVVLYIALLYRFYSYHCKAI